MRKKVYYYNREQKWMHIVQSMNRETEEFRVRVGVNQG